MNLGVLTLFEDMPAPNGYICKTVKAQATRSFTEGKKLHGVTRKEITKSNQRRYLKNGTGGIQKFNKEEKGR